jgi:Tfp pilus assembly protein PilF
MAVALTLADQGLYSEAAAQCHEILRLEPLNLEAYLLLASLSEEQGDLASAADHCQRALYLQPESIDACLALSHLYERMGDGTRAARLRVLAKELGVPG